MVPHLSFGRQILRKSDLTALPEHPQITLVHECVITAVPRLKSHYLSFHVVVISQFVGLSGQLQQQQGRPAALM